MSERALLTCLFTPLGTRSQKLARPVEFRSAIAAIRPTVAKGNRPAAIATANGGNVLDPCTGFNFKGSARDCPGTDTPQVGQSGGKHLPLVNVARCITVETKPHSAFYHPAGCVNAFANEGVRNAVDMTAGGDKVRIHGESRQVIDSP